LYTKESPATNSTLQETGKKTQGTMGRWSESMPSSYSAYGLGKKKEAKDREFWRQRIEEAKARYGL
jgi:hypothetical protein